MAVESNGIWDMASLGAMRSIREVECRRLKTVSVARREIGKETRIESVRERGMPACVSLSFGLDELLLDEG